MLYLFLRLLHIVFMALWFGAVLFLPGDVKRTLANGGDLSLLRDRAGRANRAAAAGGIGTIVTGIALIFVMGGFASVPIPIHIGLTVSLVLFGLGLFIGRTWSGIDAAIEGGTAPAELVPRAKRMGMLSGFFHLLWLTTLGLMVFRNVLM